MHPTLVNRMTSIRIAVFILATGASVAPAWAQQTPAPPAESTGSPDQPRPAVPTQVPRESNAAPAHRWVDWQIGSVETRYRYIESSAGATSANQWQHKQTIKGGFRFDREGRYSIQGLAGSGTGFTGSWDNTGAGTGDPTWNFRLRQLYVAAAPVDGIEGQVGGFGILRGEHTEITSFDNDNYMVGSRVSVRRPEELYLDEISATAGHVGDLTTPNVFRRLDRLDDHNYTQVLVAKKVGSRVSASADWTSLQGISTLRQAVRLSTKEWIPVDALRFENYQRVEGNDAYGFAITADKQFTSRLALTGGFADLDPQLPPLNGDRYGRGHRLFAESRYLLRPELTLTLFYAAAVKNDFAVANKHRFDIVLHYNVLKALQQAGAW